MIEFAATAFLMTAASPRLATSEEISPCSRTMRFEDQYCVAITAGRRWGHAEAAAAHETQARYSSPGKAAVAYVAAANNWILAGYPIKAVAAYDRALAAGLEGDDQAQAIIARDQVSRLAARGKRRP